MAKSVKNPDCKVDLDFDVSDWNKFRLSSALETALKHLRFSSPTPIQEKTLKYGLNGRDVVGAAETGSGKTLAFGIPILEYLISGGGGKNILKNKDTVTEGGEEHELKNELVGLIITPTRELAIQIRDHLLNAAKFAPGDGVKVITVIGGMSVQKQRRLMDNHPNIIIATPGRLWGLVSENNTYLDRLRRIRFFVLDEVDRMLERGRFQELNQVLSVLSRRKENTSDWNVDGIGKNDGIAELPSRQTFVFSATLNGSLKEGLKNFRNSSTGITKVKQESSQNNPVKATMEELMQRLEFSDPDPIFVDLTPKDGVSSTLQESKIECLTNEKDVYTYYFVMRYPGRTLIFVNSIDSIRRLIPIMRLLEVEVLGLHAQMQQRQRLKNLDRFKQNPKAVMIASDVASRGLDIPLVEHVIHYQLPRSVDIYVHRSGRTARANREGVSLMLCSPEDLVMYRKICQKLEKKKGLPDFPVDLGIISAMKERVTLARKIDAEEHKLQKASHEIGWLTKAAKDLEADLDDEFVTTKLNFNTRKQNLQIKSIKSELKSLLARPLVPQGVSTKYLTSGIFHDFADRLLEDDGTLLNPHLLGIKQTKATDDLKTRRKKLSKR